MIDNESIETLKQRIDVVDVVGNYIELKKAGANFKAVCPFHSDTTPSLHVSPSKQIYHCFACGAGGDAIKFVMEYEKLTYPEAIERIATMYNFSLTYKATSGEKRSEKKILDSLNLFFRQNLDKNSIAREYLKNRGIGESSVLKFEIGYAPLSHFTLNFLKGQAFTTKECIEVGVVGIGDRNEEYSRFIERITFPIHSPSGKIVGFGGRTITNHPAKYVNSPQSSVFNKSRLLYGYHLARESIAKNGRIIVCEGYLDVIMLHQAGFNEAVATLGTALTNEHIPLLTRASPKVILSYDGDSAGVEAALKAAKLLSLHNIEGGVVLFGGNMDPADMVQKGLSDKLNALYNNPRDFIEFCLEYTVKKFDLKSAHEKQKALDAALEYLKTLPFTLSSNYVGMLASMVGIKAGLIHLKSNKPTKKPLYVKSSFEDPLELSVIKTLLINPNMTDIVLDIIDTSMFKTHNEELEELLQNRRDTPSLRRLLLMDDIQIYNEEELQKALLPFLVSHYEDELEKVRNSKTLNFQQKSFYLRKIRDIIMKLKQGDLVAYESFGTF
ncbi:MAG: DNA primase [Campylobacteraceae bacterium]